jgi:putative ABC transport system permease protein
MFYLDGYAYRVIGVLEDFYFVGAILGSMPLANILRATTEPLRYFMLQIDPDQTQNALDHIEAVWKRHRPDTPVSPLFYQNRYRFVVGSWRAPIMNTTVFASVITILISICGLFALAVYSTQRRTKEVGVRKVLGATRASLVILLTWDFVKPVLIASAIACISANYGIRWVYDLFLFSPAVPYWLYAVVAVVTLAIAVGTVATLCFRAAGSNPVKSLRYE